MISETLPLPQNTISTIAPTMSQCQIDKPPMRKPPLPLGRRTRDARDGRNLFSTRRKNKNEGCPPRLFQDQKPVGGAREFSEPCSIREKRCARAQIRSVAADR